MRTKGANRQTMSRSMHALDSRLFLHTLQSPDAEPGALKVRVADLERLMAAAQEEVNMLTGERDELVAAIKKWAKADHLERQELLLETTTQELRTEIKQLRGEVKRLKRDNATLANQRTEDRAPRRLSA